MSLFDVVDLLLLVVETVVKVSVVLLAVAAIAVPLRRKFPSGAHLCWLLAFCAIIAIPFVSPFAPSKTVLHVNVLGAPSPPNIHTPIATAVPSPAVGMSGGPAPTNVSPSNTPAEFLPEPTTAALISGSPLLRGLFIVWLLGFAAIALRALHGFFCLRMIRKYGSNPLIPEQLAFETDRLALEAGVRRPFDLRISATSQLPVPMTWGVFRPTIVLPQDADLWSERRFEATLLHELSHIRRGDFLTQMLAEFACAVYWFNPIVWFSARTMRSDAELAADEAVVHTGLKPSDYAAELLTLATQLGKRPIPFATVGTPAMTHSNLESRLESILAPTSGRRGLTTLQALAAVAIAFVAVPTLAALHATTKQMTDDEKQERTIALTNAKQAALATLMYANDYDNVLPYVQQTQSAVEVLYPYCRNRDIFKSPHKGGRFLLNLNVAGVLMMDIPNPAQTPLWVESLPDPKLKMAVAFVDGHAKLYTPAQLEEAKKYAPQHFRRDKKSKPLPPNYLIPNPNAPHPLTADQALSNQRGG